MKEIELGNKILVRIDRGENVVESLEKVIKKCGIKFAKFEAIGAADKIELAFYDVETKEYKTKVFEGKFEVTSLLGNISSKDGEVIIHPHINFSNEYMDAKGGHLKEARISGTCEIVIEKVDEKIVKKFDENTGLNILDI